MGTDIHDDLLVVVGERDRAEARDAETTRNRLGIDRHDVFRVRVVVIEQHGQGRDVPGSHAERIGAGNRRFLLGYVLYAGRAGVLRRLRVVDRPLGKRYRCAIRNGPEKSAAGLVEHRAGSV